MAKASHFIGFLGAIFMTVSLTSEGEAQSTTRVDKVVSPGGITAWLVEENTLPIIAMNFAFEGGSAQEPDGREGLANLAAALLDEGAGELDSFAFSKALQDRSIQISFDASRDALYGSMRTLAPELDEAARLLAMAVNEPRFDEEPLDRTRAKIIAKLRSELRDPDAIASKTLTETIFPAHPYGRPTDGTLETVPQLTQDDISNFYKRIAAKENLHVAVVGNISSERLGTLLDEVFGSLPEKPDLKTIEEMTPVAGLHISKTEDVPQTVIRLAAPGIKRDDPDFIPAFVANHILGGGVFSSRMFVEVREKRGLSYSVYTYLADFDHAGLFAGGASTSNERVQEALDVMLSEISRMGEEGPTQEELDKAKRYLTGSYPLRFDSSTKIARQLVEIQLADLGIDYIDKRNDLIEKVTLEDVKRVSQRLFTVKPTVITVGQPESNG
jgi:zinc protease